MWNKVKSVSSLGPALALVCGVLAASGLEAAKKNVGNDSTKAARCRYEEPIPSTIDLCPLLERAHQVLPRLTSSAAEYLQRVAAGFDPERSLRVQQGLLREDLQWQSRGFTRRQMDLMVFVSVALSLDAAEVRVAELRRKLQDGGDSKAPSRIESVNLYRSQALDLLEQLSTSLGSLSNYDLSFRF